MRAAEIEAFVRTSIALAEAAGPPPRESLIEDVYAQPTWLQREQLAALLKHPPAANPHHR